MKKRRRSEKNIQLDNKKLERSEFFKEKNDQVLKQNIAITSNRITQKVGLFNKLKYSDTVYREPIKISKAVNVKSAADLLRIVDRNKFDDSFKQDQMELYSKYGANSTEKLSCSNGKTKNRRSRSGPRSSTPMSVSPETASTFPNDLQIKKEIESSTPCIRSKATEIAKSASTIIRALDNNTCFPGKNYLKERKIELIDIFKTNLNLEDSKNKTNTPTCVLNTSIGLCHSSSEKSQFSKSADSKSSSKKSIKHESINVSPKSYPSSLDLKPNSFSLKEKLKLPPECANTKYCSQHEDYAEFDLRSAEFQLDQTAMDTLSQSPNYDLPSKAMTDAKVFLDCHHIAEIKNNQQRYIFEKVESNVDLPCKNSLYINPSSSKRSQNIFEKYGLTANKKIEKDQKHFSMFSDASLMDIDPSSHNVNASGDHCCDEHRLFYSHNRSPRFKTHSDYSPAFNDRKEFGGYDLLEMLDKEPRANNHLHHASEQNHLLPHTFEPSNTDSIFTGHRSMSHTTQTKYPTKPSLALASPPKDLYPPRDICNQRVYYR